MRRGGARRGGARREDAGRCGARRWEVVEGGGRMVGGWGKSCEIGANQIVKVQTVEGTVVLT